MKIKIDPYASIPRSLQIRNAILDYIRKEKLKPGTRIPSIHELSRENRLNAKTVAKTYKMLEDEGYVNLMGGSGTYIRSHAVLGRILFILEDPYRPTRSGHDIATFHRFVLRPFETEFFKRGYLSDFCFIDQEWKEDVVLMKKIYSSQYSGVILRSPVVPASFVDCLERLSVPVVNIFQGNTHLDALPHVIIDYGDFFDKAIQQIRRRKFRKPCAFLKSRVYRNGIFENADPYVRKLFQDEGLLRDDRQIHYCDYEASEPMRVCRDLELFLSRNKESDCLLIDRDGISEIAQLVIMKQFPEWRKLFLILHGNLHLLKLFALPVQMICMDPMNYVDTIVKHLLSGISKSRNRKTVFIKFKMLAPNESLQI